MTSFLLSLWLVVGGTLVGANPLPSGGEGSKPLSHLVATQDTQGASQQKCTYWGDLVHQCTTWWADGTTQTCTYWEDYQQQCTTWWQS